jgi:cell division protein FtsQ
LDRSGAFSVQRVAVVGAPKLAGDVRAAATGAVGRGSMLAVDARAVEAAVESLPHVRSASVDRAFPHTLRVTVVPERAVALVRRGNGVLALAASGRVLGTEAASRGLPMIAAAPGDLPGVGGTVRAPKVLEQLNVAAAPHRGLRISAIGYGDDGLIARTAGGTDLRIGDNRDLAIKLKVARSVLRRAGSDAVYVDVTVPTAPVLRGASADPITANAPVPAASALPPVGDLGAWVAGGTPAESIRTLFG